MVPQTRLEVPKVTSMPLISLYISFVSHLIMIWAVLLALLLSYCSSIKLSISLPPEEQRCFYQVLSNSHPMQAPSRSIWWKPRPSVRFLTGSTSTTRTRRSGSTQSPAQLTTQTRQSNCINTHLWKQSTLSALSVWGGTLCACRSS